MQKIFNLVYECLIWLSTVTGLTYAEVNVIIWFIAIPFVFIYLIERLIKTNFLKLCYLGIVLLVFFLNSDFELLSKKLFEKSKVFLQWFAHLGLNYVQASVLICVIFPILIVVFLVLLRKQQKR